MKEVEALMRRAQKALQTATTLLREGDPDSCASRSYYAMFYAAEAVLLTKSVKFSSHRSVISLFGRHFVKAGVFPPRFGRNLKEAFTLRLKGDYAYDAEITKAEAEETLGWAREFVGEVKKYLQAARGGEVEDPARRVG